MFLVNFIHSRCCKTAKNISSETVSPTYRVNLKARRWLVREKRKQGKIKTIAFQKKRFSHLKKWEKGKS